jgi:hypothetical protein
LCYSFFSLPTEEGARRDYNNKKTKELSIYTTIATDADESSPSLIKKEQKNKKEREKGEGGKKERKRESSLLIRDEEARFSGCL